MDLMRAVPYARHILSSRVQNQYVRLHRKNSNHDGDTTRGVKCPEGTKSSSRDDKGKCVRRTRRYVALLYEKRRDSFPCKARHREPESETNGWFLTAERAGQTRPRT